MEFAELGRGRGTLVSVHRLEIEGESWRLRAPTENDVSAIAHHGRAGDAAWIGIGALADPDERVAEVMTEFLKGASGSFGLAHLVVTKAAGEIVGEIGVHDRGGCYELAYGIAPAWRSRGLATEVLTAVTGLLRSEEPSQRLELVIAQHNLRSVSVAVKSGYRLAGLRRSFVEGTGETFEDLVYVAP